MYGPRQALSNPYTGVAAIFCSRLLNGKSPVIFEDGHQRRDFVHVSDIVQASLLALDRAEVDFGAFNVGSGRSLAVLDIAEQLGKHLGSHQSGEIAQKFRAGDIRHCFADVSRLQALGYRPGVRFEDGVEELTDWVRMQEAVDSFEQAREELSKRGLAA